MEKTSCLVCETTRPHHLSHLSCSCLFCHDCLSSWFVEALNSLNIYHIKCPNYKCAQIYSTFKFLEFFPISQKTHLETILVRKILNLDQDYIVCSNSQCNNIGFKFNGLCLDTFRCSICDTECKNLTVWNKKPKSLLTGIIDFSNEWLENAYSGIYQDLFTKECLGCGMAISKNGGCNHMSCKKCQKEFCWKCLQYWKIHKEYLCLLREILKWSLIVIIFILGGSKVGIYENWDLMEVYGKAYYLSFIALNILLAYSNFSLFLLFYLPFLIILYSIIY